LSLRQSLLLIVKNQTRVEKKQQSISMLKFEFGYNDCWNQEYKINTQLRHRYKKYAHGEH